MKLQEGRFIQGLRNMFSLRWDMADPDEIHNTIISGAKLQGTNMCILMLAILIASIGLNMNSTAVIAPRSDGRYNSHRLRNRHQ